MFPTGRALGVAVLVVMNVGCASTPGLLTAADGSPTADGIAAAEHEWLRDQGLNTGVLLHVPMGEPIRVVSPKCMIQTERVYECAATHIRRSIKRTETRRYRLGDDGTWRVEAPIEAR